MEIFAIGVLVFAAFNYSGVINFNVFFKDNDNMIFKLKEDDYDFLVAAKYGSSVDPNTLFSKRVKNGVLVLAILFFAFITNISFLNVLFASVGGYIVFKSGYSNLKNYYKKHLHEIDLLLPYYLKSLEILIQHYTVPVAITKSLKDAPDMFKPGLKELISSIDAGNSSIDPYMEFAKKYPVRDSMRMMRLLYRLGLGNQDRKDEQLIVFSRTISSLQAKSRETKYKERLDKMEKKTLVMLSTTGVGVLMILLLSILRIFTF